jgi:hypothetical protein
MPIEKIDLDAAIEHAGCVPQPCGIALTDDSTPAVSGPPPVVQGGPAWSKVVQGDP